MSISPSVELRFNPTDLRPQDLRAGKFLGTPAEAIEAGIAVARATMVDQMKAEIRAIADPTEAQLLAIADAAWQITFWRFRKMSAPVIADAYIRAYRAADAGDVPMHLVYSLADQHAEKIGHYFHETSRAALAEGFNNQVNRRIPAKAAAMRVMDAYGLAPRQMRGYNAATATLTSQVVSVLPRPLQAKARAYIERALTTRIKKLSKQEEHNIDQQAQQFAWMWLQDKGRLSKRAQKIWITAKDERVCKVCGPLHGMKIGVNERFRTKEGEFWTPGLHPNCRCVVRLIENRFSKSLTATALADFNDDHPRGFHGRFTEVRNQPGPSAVTRTDEETRRMFEEIVSRIPPTGVGTPTVGRTPFGAKGHVQPVADFTAPVIAAPVVTPPDARPTEYVGIRPQAADTRPKAADTRPEAAVITRPKAGLLVPTRLQVLEAQIRSSILARARTRTPPDTQTVTTRQGQRTDAPVGDVVWAVIDETDRTRKGNIRLNQHKTFMTNKQEAEQEAAQNIRDDVDREVARVMKKGASFQLSGIKKWVLPEDQVRAVVEYQARVETARRDDDPLWRSRNIKETMALTETPMIKAQMFEIDGTPVMDKHGQQKSINFSASMMAHELQVDQAKFSQQDIVAVNTEVASNLEGETIFRPDPESVTSTYGDYTIPNVNIHPVRGTPKKRD